MNESTYQSKAEALVVCSYCSRRLTNPTKNIESMSPQSTQVSLQISHGVCPDCLLAHHPQEYLLIQSEQRLRIKHAFHNDLASFFNKYL